jgi:hypothetical protein
MTKKEIVKEILIRYPAAVCKIEKTALGKGVIYVECWHGDAERIGQFVSGHYPDQIQTYFACGEFRKAHLSIYFKR